MNYSILIEKSIIYIEDHIESPLNLESLADHFNTSKYYYHRLFSAVMGCTFQQYVQRRKANWAVKQIKESDKSLTELTYLLGFSDQAAFTRTFKKEMGFSPGQLRKNPELADYTALPEVVHRQFKNLKGDVVTDFTLEHLASVKITGLAFEVDLGDPFYKDVIRQQASLVRQEAGQEQVSESYMIYSGCQPGSSRFKALFGLPYPFVSSLPHVFTIDLPPFFTARFGYKGDLLEISDIFTTDFARFLKLSRMKPEESHIELIQIFNENDRDMTNYDICVPIEKNKDDPSDSV